MVYDRTMTNLGYPQLFGSQVRLNMITNKFITEELQKSQLLNAYRLYFGFTDIETYLNMMNNRNL